ncbi:DUF1857 family protein [Pseudothauera nasutitermitis]|uniref:DUF1857 family protein n=1 Tax=Pseudothauera nasutitermitis TaxID=2565930 RepID=A0A4S4AXA2_9RHOO|nr:SRPBCC family protein [Pseudothauera nasutitermitis]THF64530.1 DUF1857 family protein [Pseudothauera nasutitermitis]
MKFEHLVQVNDLADPALTPLTREELWFGLLCRAEDPRPFLPGLERCVILERREDVLERELHFGGAVVRDRVSLAELQWVRFESAATAEHAGGSLTIAIEEPRPGELFLRFTYATTLPEGGQEVAVAEYVRSAYHESDLDTLRVIRMIAASSTEQ